MSTQRQLSDSELKSIKSEMEELNFKVQSNKVSGGEALKEAYAKRDLLRETLDRNSVSDERKETWRVINDLVKVFSDISYEEERAAGPKFKAGDFLDASTMARVTEVKRLIRSMSLNGKKSLTREEERYAEKGEKQVTDERHARIRLAMLNDYGKLIDKDHPVLKELWQMYNDKTISNYMKYAQSVERNQIRDAELVKKIKQNMTKYSDKNFVQAVLNLLEPKFPESQGSEE